MTIRFNGLRESLKRAGAASSRVLLKDQAPHRRVVGLCYHSIHPTSSFASASPDLFERHLAWLAEACDVIPLRTMLAATADHNRDRPAVAITFDDGYADNHEFALTLLQKYKMHATIFVTTGFCDRDPAVITRFQALRGVSLDELNPLDWTQIVEMQRAGLEIGAHTHSHPNLIRLSREKITEELRVSKQILENRLSAPIDLMAYPFGKPNRQFDCETMDIAQGCGYTQAAAVLFRGVRTNDSPLALPRFFTTRSSVDDLSAKVRGYWDYLGIWQEHAPRVVARMVSPQDFRF